ncbi:MAG: hypothetical protein E6R09_07765 [Rhodocyclaceae bacterium]|nr:MAG: hypothetical protein E6R09_07765 [Rhodocyclaceae bacterium]
MSDLSFHVRQYVPTANGADLESRVALLKARDWAAVMRSQVDSDFARQLVVEAHETAGAFVFAKDETPERLAFAVKLCRHLVGAAVIAEQLENGEVRI